jgi:hypothetical protein
MSSIDLTSKHSYEKVQNDNLIKELLNVIEGNSNVEKALKIIDNIVEISKDDTEWVNTRFYGNEWSFAHLCLINCEMLPVLAKLLDLGLNPNLINKKGDAAIHIFESEFSILPMNLLLMYGADIL